MGIPGAQSQRLRTDLTAGEGNGGQEQTASAGLGSPASKRWWFEAALPAGTGAVAVTPRGGLQKLKVTPLPPRRQRGLGIQRNDGSARKNNLAQVAGLNSLAISCLALVPLPRVMIFSLFDLFPAAQTDNTHPCCLIKPGSPQDCQRQVPICPAPQLRSASLQTGAAAAERPSTCAAQTWAPDLSLACTSYWLYLRHGAVLETCHVPVP